MPEIINKTGNKYKILQIMEITGKINICQPDERTSCALCCGSHNYNAKHKDVISLFRKRTKIYSQYNHSDTTASIQKCANSLKSLSLPTMIDDAIQCSYIGYISEDLIGCLLYSNNSQPDMRDTTTKSTTCTTFSCLARSILTNEEILYASQLMDGWFYYSLFIHEIMLLREIRTEYAKPDQVPITKLEYIRQNLRADLYKGSSLPVPGNQNFPELTGSRQG